ncbi:hypothetical protein Godav_025762, partial [Gossypium davidsonii]|nr:hypothetical protein [Gossypium davidsonii]MBA0640573.1 hypothetical protein [Gossypium klotzschianum]
YKEAVQFKTRSFPYYEQLTSIYTKDRTTGKDAQTTGDIFKELCAEDVANEMNPEEGSNDNKREVDASLDEMDVSATQSQQFNPNKVDSTFPKKKKSFEASEPNSSTSLIDAATLLGDNIRTVDL